ncbi:MAG: iron-containing alcohol dehydrogenase [Ruminococcaceae bacterium]|nr:iron-containing alcohol dehydrogenase [Oscillospiraceae bacterium]
MDNFEFYSPTYFVFGKNTEEKAGELVKKFGGSKVLVHFGGGSVVRSGLLDRVCDSLRKENIEYVKLGGVMPNPRSSLVYEGIELCRKENVDFILAVGGGSTIDSAKAIALGAVYDGDFWDYFGGGTVTNSLPIGTVLTIAAAGSEGSPNTVITHENGMYKRSTKGDCLRPKFSILNPELTTTLPAFQSASGITDIVAHLYERYLTNTKDVEVTDRLIEALLLTMKSEAPKVIENPKDYEARANIMWAGMLAHNNMCGVGRSQDWNSHSFEHELSALYDCAHGAGLAVAMPAVLRYVVKKDVMRFAKVANRVWGCDMDFDNPERTAIAGIDALQNFFISIGMPKNFEELGAKEEDIDYLVETLCCSPERNGYIEGYVKLDKEDCKNIYRLML